MYIITLPIRTVSEANIQEHWTKRRKRHQVQAFLLKVEWNRHNWQPVLPCMVKLIRIAPRKLDHEDNLRMSFKSLKDEIAGLLRPDLIRRCGKGGRAISKGFCDSAGDITWLYAQEKGKPKEYAVKIEISQ